MVILRTFATLTAAFSTLAAAQGTPVQTCTVTLVDPPSAGKICGSKGHFRRPNSHLISRQKVTGADVDAKLEACRKVCFANSACKSFALNTANSFCRLLSAETNDIGPLLDGNRSPNIHYDNTCYEETCTSCTPLLPSDFPTGPLTNPDVVFGNHSKASVDDAVFRINAPYPLTFFNANPTTAIYMHSNGWASLSRNAGWDYYPQDLPADNNDGSSYTSSFFPFWADFYVASKTDQGLYFQIKQSTDTVDLSNTALASPKRKRLSRRQGGSDDTNSRTVTLEWLVSRSVSPSDPGDPSILWHFQTILFADRPNVVVYNYIQVPDSPIDHTVGAQYGGDGVQGDYAQYFDDVTSGTLLVYDYENSPGAGFQAVTPGVCTPDQEAPPPA